MPVIILPTFAGEVPRTTPRLLDATQAQIAINCNLERGSLAPLRGPGHVQAIDRSCQTIFRHQQDGWLAWPSVVSVVRSAVYDYSGDTPLGQIFATGLRDYPVQYLAGGTVRRLGIPRPAQAPRATVTGIPIPPEDPLDSGIERSTSYCYTLVQSLADGVIQQESAPSPATPVLDICDGQGVLLEGFAVPELEGLVITHVRLYRTMSGTGSSEFHFVAELPASAPSCQDDTHDKDLSAEVLQTSTWDPIPDDATGLILTNNGIYACFRGNELLLSEPNYSYAYPTDYRLTVEDRIVALGHTDNTIIVLTEGRPYLLTGMEPSLMQLTHLPLEQACVSARSVAHVPGGLIYASPDGLMLFTANDQTLLTAGTFTRDQWRALGPASLLGAVLNGQYIGFFAGSSRGFVYTIGAQDIVRVELPDGMTVRGLYQHSLDDCLYLSIDSANGCHGIWQWEAGENMPYIWRSRQFFTSRLVAMRAVRVEGDQSRRQRLEVRLYGARPERARELLRLQDRRTKRTTTTRSDKLWAVELRGTTPVYELRLGSSVEELEYGQ